MSSCFEPNQAGLFVVPNMVHLKICRRISAEWMKGSNPNCHFSVRVTSIGLGNLHEFYVVC